MVKYRFIEMKKVKSYPISSKRYYTVQACICINLKVALMQDRMIALLKVQTIVMLSNPMNYGTTHIKSKRMDL